MELQEKYERLKQILAGYGSVAVAFSGGVDSTFLLSAAQQALGGNVLAVTAVSGFLPKADGREAEQFCRERGIRHLLFEADVLHDAAICANPPDRCYLCKRKIFTELGRIARENGVMTVADGSNTDDAGDYRPGLRAIRELGVQSPLKEAGLSKAEIRFLSRKLGLPTWDKPSAACLASRFVYGETIDETRLAMVERAEACLRELGLRQLRVRVHGLLARIEVAPEELSRLVGEETRQALCSRLKELGFSYVTLDLQGYRTGSMNEALALSANDERGGA